MNLALHQKTRKKKNNLVIPSIRFTKQIIHLLQKRFKFHQRADSPLHMPTDEHVLGNLKFTAKGLNYEIFGMNIPENLLTSNILNASYYQDYFAKVEAYLKRVAGEELASATIKPSKSKPTYETFPKKRKKSSSASDISKVGKKSKKGVLGKKRDSNKQRKLIDQAIDEEDPHSTSILQEVEHDILQHTLDVSAKEHAESKGHTITGVTIREPAAERLQPLLDVEGKGKQIATEELAAQTLLNISSPAPKI